MLYRRKTWRECHAQNIANPIHAKIDPVPNKSRDDGAIVGNPVSRDKVRDRQPERHIHRNAQRILNNQDLDFKLSREIIKANA